MNKLNLFSIMLTMALLLACGNGDRHFAAVYADEANYDKTLQAIQAWNKLDPEHFGLVMATAAEAADVTVTRDNANLYPNDCAHTHWGADASARPPKGDYSTSYHAAITLALVTPEGCRSDAVAVAHELGHYMSGEHLHSGTETDLMYFSPTYNNLVLSGRDADFAYNRLTDLVDVH